MSDTERRLGKRDFHVHNTITLLSETDQRKAQQAPKRLGRSPTHSMLAHRIQSELDFTTFPFRTSTGRPRVSTRGRYISPPLSSALPRGARCGDGGPLRPPTTHVRDGHPRHPRSGWASAFVRDVHPLRVTFARDPFGDTGLDSYHHSYVADEEDLAGDVILAFMKHQISARMAVDQGTGSCDNPCRPLPAKKRRASSQCATHQEPRIDAWALPLGQRRVDADAHGHRGSDTNRGSRGLHVPVSTPVAILAKLVLDDVSKITQEGDRSTPRFPTFGVGYTGYDRLRVCDTFASYVRSSAKWRWTNLHRSAPCTSNGRWLHQHSVMHLHHLSHEHIVVHFVLDSVTITRPCRSIFHFVSASFCSKACRSGIDIFISISVACVGLHATLNVASGVCNCSSQGCLLVPPMPCSIVTLIGFSLLGFEGALREFFHKRPPSRASGEFFQHPTSASLLIH